MPPALVDLIPVLALAALLAVAFAHRPEWLEATVEVAAVVLVLTATDLGSPAAAVEVRRPRSTCTGCRCWSRRRASLPAW